MWPKRWPLPASADEDVRAVYRLFLNREPEDEGVLHRHPARLRNCVEFGCGVGRVTVELATLFETVTGCDISAPHLRLAGAEAARRQLHNPAWHRSSMASPMPATSWDFWCSRIVLQHNPPPVMAMLSRQAFAGLRPGGVAIFQLPTHCLSYSFRVADYLAGGQPLAMEMHVLPQASVFALAAEAGLQVLEVRENTHVIGAADNAAGWLSNLFVLRRPGQV